MEPTLKTATVVPWDRAELHGRECQSCACYFESVNPENKAQFQGFCRRQPADFAETRGLEPRLDPATGKPMMKNGQPVMNQALIKGYLFKPTQREGVCFDGYRPKGTLPGDRGSPFIGPKLQGVMLRLLERMGESLPPELKNDLRELLTDTNGSA